MQLQRAMAVVIKQADQLSEEVKTGGAQQNKVWTP